MVVWDTGPMTSDGPDSDPEPEPGSSEAIAAVFGRAAATYDEAIPYFERFGRRLVDHAAPPVGSAVLDVACGRGASLIPAATQVGSEGHVVGIDLAPEMVERLRADVAARRLTNAEVTVGNAQALDFADESFDVVQCGFSIMLVPDPAAAAAEMARVLRPGGRIALSMPTGAGPEWAFFGELVMQFAPRARGPVPPPRPPLDLDALLAGVDLTHRTIIDEVEDFRFADDGVWWQWVWSQGMRGYLEALSDDDVEAFRRAAIERLDPLRADDGSVALAQQVRYALATKG